MARPNFNDRSWQDIDWEAWAPQFSITDRATSLRELQNGIGTRYIEVQNLLSRLPPHAGKAKSLIALWRHEANGYGRTIVFSESSRILRRLDDLFGQVTAQLQAVRQAAKATRKLQKLRPPTQVSSGAARPPATAGHAAHGTADDDTEFFQRFDGMSHSAATSRQRSDARSPTRDTAAARWAAVQAAMASECDTCRSDSVRPVTNRHFRTALDVPDDLLVEQFQQTRGANHVRIVVAGKTQFWTTGLPNLEQLGIARYSIYRRNTSNGRFDYVAGIRRPEEAAAEREAANRVQPARDSG